MQKPVLIILAHPDLSKSTIHRALVASMPDKQIKMHDLSKTYPDYKIDVLKEQQLLLESDEIVMQFPFYWYSAPAILKAWQDQVLTYGFAYGKTGIALRGKKLRLVISTGGPQDAYRAEGYNHFTMQELLRPFEQMANLTGMTFLPPLILHGAMNQTKESIAQFATSYNAVLAA